MAEYGSQHHVLIPAVGRYKNVEGEHLLLKTCSYIIDAHVQLART